LFTKNSNQSKFTVTRICYLTRFCHLKLHAITYPGIVIIRWKKCREHKQESGGGEKNFLPTSLITFSLLTKLVAIHCHFAVLGFTKALGESVYCIIIIAAAEVRAKDIMGLQPWVTTIGYPSINFEDNSNGPKKYYSFGPICIVNGSSVPAVVTFSESGSITSNILMQVMEHLDEKLCFH
jgi:hypothetical protein